jgi:hypothetical protein
MRGFWASTVRALGIWQSVQNQYEIVQLLVRNVFPVSTQRLQSAERNFVRQISVRQYNWIYCARGPR